jgi:O-antigen/teichoic acid export membrane protein
MSSAFGRVAALRGALMMTGSTYAVYALGLVVSALIARDLGPDSFGHYAYLVWLSGMLGIIANNGLTTSGIRFVSESLGRQDRDAAARVQGWLWRRQLLCLLAVAALYAASLPFIERSGWQQEQLLLFTALAILSMSGKSLFIFYISMAKGHGRFDIEAGITVALGLLNAVAVVVLAWRGASLLAYLLVFTVTSLAFGLLGFIAARRAGVRGASDAPAPELLARLRPHLYWTIALVIAAALGNKSVETYLLNLFTGAAAVGYFAIAAALTRGGVDLLSSGLSSVLMPMMAHAYGAQGLPQVNRVLGNAVRIFLFFGLLLAGSAALAADLAVQVLYGSAYTPVADVFRWMVIVGGLSLSEGAFGALLSTTDHQRLRALIAASSILLTIGLALWWIPLYGLMGALAAHAASRMLLMLVLVTGSRIALGLRLPWRQLSRLALAALLATAPALAIALNTADPWLRFGAGVLYALLFLGLTLLLRAWRSEDADTLYEALGRLPRARAMLGPLLQGWSQRMREREA